MLLRWAHNHGKKKCVPASEAWIIRTRFHEIVLNSRRNCLNEKLEEVIKVVSFQLRPLIWENNFFSTEIERHVVRLLLYLCSCIPTYVRRKNTAMFEL